jgi:hypothetical protein
VSAEQLPLPLRTGYTPLEIDALIDEWNREDRQPRRRRRPIIDHEGFAVGETIDLAAYCDRRARLSA